MPFAVDIPHTRTPQQIANIATAVEIRIKRDFIMLASLNGGNQSRWFRLLFDYCFYNREKYQARKRRSDSVSLRDSAQSRVSERGRTTSAQVRKFVLL
jgi:hypothetical protein